MAWEATRLVATGATNATVAVVVAVLVASSVEAAVMVVAGTKTERESLRSLLLAVSAT